MFDPVQASEEIKNSYIDYITTSFDIADKAYAELFRKELESEGMAAKGPYLDIGGSYVTGRTLRELMDAGEASHLFEELEPIPEKERELKLERPLYLHQENALRKANAGKNLVVTTGTGSGKTESFLIPIIQHILTQLENGELDAGVRAIIIYPMNALANDQIKRMRALLRNFGKIRFGIYNGNTEHERGKALREYRKAHKDASGAPVDPLPNELISREEMQADPPHILITNYSMLEYMMLRPKDDSVFSGAKLKYIVLDEAHIYKGATGMETSLLMRRLRARISEPDSVQYILTSATLGGPDADGEILQFAEKLTGVRFEADGIIRSKEKMPSYAGENQIQKNKRIRVKGFCCQNRIDDHPQDQHACEREDKRPAAREFRNRVRRALPERVFFRCRTFGNLAVCQQIQDFLVRHIMFNILEDFFQKFSVFFHKACPFIPEFLHYYSPQFRRGQAACPARALGLSAAKQENARRQKTSGHFLTESVTAYSFWPRRSARRVRWSPACCWR